MQHLGLKWTILPTSRYVIGWSNFQKQSKAKEEGNFQIEDCSSKGYLLLVFYISTIFYKVQVDSVLYF